MLPIICRPSTRNTVIIAYRPRFVSERLKSPIIGAETLRKGTTSNCSSGDVIKCVMMTEYIK
ncbi:hypothetical protein GCM10027018_24750 [Paenibacillus thermoaerophilus]